MSRRRAPGRVLTWLAARLVAPHDREFLLADLDDEAARRRAAGRRVTGWYLAQLLHAALTRRGRGAPAATLRTVARSVAFDARLALRGFRRQPGFTAVVVGSLALGIGGATAGFSVARAVLLAPLPYSAPESLVMIWSRFPGADKTWVADREVLDYRAQARTLAGVAMWQTDKLTLTGGGEAVRVSSAAVTPNTFAVLGIRPDAGRFFDDDDARVPDAAPVPVVISHRLWRSTFGGDPAMASREVSLDGRPARIIGIAPQDFRLPTDYTRDAVEPTELWTPLHIDPASSDRDSHSYYAVARLAPGVSPADASRELAQLTQAWMRDGLYRSYEWFSAFAVPVTDDVLASVRRALWAVFAAVLCLLLIACANVSGLLLARAESRAREQATRTALGGTRARLIGAQLVESVVLAAIAGAAGLGLAVGAGRVLAALGVTAIPRADAIGVDWRVFGFLVLTVLAAALLAAVAPALRAARRNLAEGLRSSAATAMLDPARVRLRTTLVVVQLAFAVALLAGAGVMLRTMLNLRSIDLGFNPHEVLTARLALPDRPYDTPERVVEFYTRLLDEVRDIPGVQAAGFVRLLPLGSTMGNRGIAVEGYTAPRNTVATAEWQIVTPGAIEALGERIVRGRAFTEADTGTAQQVMVVNETMAREYWPGADPIGKRVRVGFFPEAQWTTVVGVVADIRHNAITGVPARRFYRPLAQWIVTNGGVPRAGALVVRSDRDRDLVPEIRARLRALDADVPLSGVRSMDEVVNTALATPRVTSSVLTAVALGAVLFGAMGTYGLIAFVVAQRTREFGIRVALGASQSDVGQLVLRYALRLAAGGLVIGAALALGATRLLAGVLYGVGPLDPVSLGGAAAVLAATAAVAALLPAARAVRLTPSEALRDQ
jgi:predicted permease